MRPQTADNTYDTIQVNTTFDLNDRFQLKTGYFFKDYTFATTERRRDPASCSPPLAVTANAEACIPASVAGAALSSYSRTVGFSDGWDIPSGTALNWLIPDYQKASDLFGFDGYALSWQPASGNNRSVQEKTTGAYAQIDFDLDTAIPIRGNIGTRYVTTDQSSKGYQIAAGAPIEVRASRTYSDWLPSANIVIEPRENLLVRLAAAKVMSRPGLGNLTPGGSVSVSGNNRTVSSGNPMLDATKATTYDIGVEWYFAPESILALGVFHKKIDSFIATQSTTGPFTGNALGIPDSVAIAACGSVAGCSASADWVFNKPVNTEGGDLTGFEVSYQQPFTFLPGLWSNFGVMANYTFVDSEIEYPNGTTNTLTELSKNAYNGTLYYEDDRFSARVSGTYRDGYLTQVPGRNGNAIEGVVDTFNVDASASWQVSESFTLTLEGINLTDEVPTQYVGDYNLVSVHHHTGRQVFAGFRYKF
jgi:TonB-dependent receptor